MTMPACVRASFRGVDSRGCALWEIETTPLGGESKIGASGTDLSGLLMDAMKEWPLVGWRLERAVSAAVERANEQIQELARHE